MKKIINKYSKATYLFVITFILLVGASYALTLSDLWVNSYLNTDQLTEQNAFADQNFKNFLDAINFLYQNIVFDGASVTFKNVNDVIVYHHSDSGSDYLATEEDLQHEINNLINLDCKWIPSETGWVNSYDNGMGIYCSGGFLAGIESQHGGGYHDNRFRFLCCKFQGQNIANYYKCDGPNQGACPSNAQNWVGYTS